MTFSHIGGFVASYLEDGLASPLMLQIADELRQTLPDILGPHPLTQAWAFKGLKPDATVDLHADDAAISVNLWLTPNTANSEPETGGLIVYTEPPPADWVITGYDEDHASIDEFARKHAGTARTFHMPKTAQSCSHRASSMAHTGLPSDQGTPITALT